MGKPGFYLTCQGQRLPVLGGWGHFVSVGKGTAFFIAGNGSLIGWKPTPTTGKRRNMKGRPMSETFITPNQLAKTLGVKPDKVLAWIHAGQLVAVNVAENPNGQRPRWRIDPDEVARFLKSRQNKPAEPTTTVRRRRKTKPTRQWV